MASKYEAAKRLITVTIPILGLMVIASACSSPEPTVEQIRGSLPRPGINPNTTLVYTNQPQAEFSVSADNIYADHPEVSISPAGATWEWQRETWYNPFSPKNKLVVEGLPNPNITYRVSMKGENCTKYKGDMICTDPVEKAVDIVYDTLPPEANVIGVEARGGQLTIRTQVTDNLSGPQEGSVDAIVKAPVLGVNQTKIKVCDNAGNCGESTVSGNYSPFEQVLNIPAPIYDYKTGKVTIQGTINNGNENLDLSKTQISAKQAVLPEMAFDVNKVGLECGVPQFDGFNFKVTCDPKRPDGRTIVKVVIYDKLGNKYSQNYEVEIPPLDRRRSNMFYTLLTMAFLADTSLYGKVRGDRVRRQRRAVLAEAMAHGNRQAFLDAKQKLVKKDRKTLTHIEADFDAMQRSEEFIISGKPREALTVLKDLYRRPPHLMEEKRDELAMKAIGLIARAVSEKNWQTLEKSEVKAIMGFLWNSLNDPHYNFLWTRIAKVRGLKNTVLSVLILYRGSNANAQQYLGQKNIVFGFGLNDPAIFFEYFHEMMQWGDYRSVKVALEALKGGFVSGRIIAEASTRLASEEEKVLEAFSNALRKTDDIAKFEEKLQFFESMKKSMDSYRFTDEGVQNLAARMRAKESEFRKMVAISKVVDNVKQLVPRIAQQDWTPLKPGADVSAKPEDKHSLVIASLPQEVKLLLEGKGRWHKYILSEDCPFDQAEPLLNALILQEFMPYALFFGTDKAVDASVNFQTVLPFNPKDRSFIRLFSELFGAYDQTHLAPNLFYLRMLWDKMTKYKEAEMAIADTDLQVQDLLLGFDNAIEGKIRTMLFMTMAIGMNYQPQIGKSNVPGLVSIFIKYR